MHSLFHFINFLVFTIFNPGPLECYVKINVRMRQHAQKLLCRKFYYEQSLLSRESTKIKPSLKD